MLTLMCGYFFLKLSSIIFCATARALLSFGFKKVQYSMVPLLTMAGAAAKTGLERNPAIAAVAAPSPFRSRLFVTTWLGFPISSVTPLPAGPPVALDICISCLLFATDMFRVPSGKAAGPTNVAGEFHEFGRRPGARRCDARALHPMLANYPFEPAGSTHACVA